AKVLVAVNKVETKEIEKDIFEFYNLGLGDPIAISAEQSLGLGDLLDEVVEKFHRNPSDEEMDTRTKIAVLGKPNAGKSTIVNKLLGEDRVIVSDVAGTTRDAIDSTFQYHQEEYVIIDTAGIRRKSKINDEIERYSILRAVTAVERADVALIVIDGAEGISEQDAKIAGIAHNRGKATIIVVNKWDVVEKDEKKTKQMEKEIREILSFNTYAPILFLSALTGQRFHQIMETVIRVSNEHAKRIPTGTLNEIIGEAVLMNPPPADKGRRLKIYYLTQTGVKPPTFVLFVNDKKLMHFSYQRYLENKLRQGFDFTGTPLRLYIREKKDS
ncbi:MAG TPA: ribosome biogenesis GTPase Der, partial [Eubacteriaceae bacterium]|nr:ribosome biogenesis GTPase Der [Eubacteriaceae bacterium]